MQGGWSTSWNDVSIDTDAPPFYLVYAAKVPNFTLENKHFNIKKHEDGRSIRFFQIKDG